MNRARKRLFIAAAVLTVVNGGLLAFVLSYSYGLDRTFFSIEHALRFYDTSTENQFDKLVLGDSSSAYGIMVRQIPNTVSLAIPSSTSVSSYSEFRRFKDRGKHAKCLIFYNSYIAQNLQRGLGDKYPRGGLFKPADLEKYLQPLVELAPSLQSIISSYRLHYYSGLSSLRQYHLRKALTPNHPGVAQFATILHDLSESGGYIRSKGQRRFFDPERHDYLLTEFQANPVEDAAFHELLGLTRSENMRFVYVGIPVGVLPNETRPQVYQKQHWQHVAENLNKHPHAKFLAPKMGGPLALTNDDYLDLNHLNEDGARKYTEWLGSEIQSACEPPDGTTEDNHASDPI